MTDAERPPLPVTVRRATAADAVVITELTNALLGTTTFEWTDTPYEVDERRAWLATHEAEGRPILVAEDQGAVVAWAGYGDFRDTRKWPGYRFTAEHTVHVAREYWGAGVARPLMEVLIDQARSAGLWVMIGAIDGSNERSIRFHERLGFRQVARLPGVGEKAGRRLDLVLVQLDLVPQDKAAR